jgi:hypothetical protein
MFGITWYRYGQARPPSRDEQDSLLETRAMATDQSARTKFRSYWSFLSPGIILIRWAIDLSKSRPERPYGQATQCTTPGC